MKAKTKICINMSQKTSGSSLSADILNVKIAIVPGAGTSPLEQNGTSGWSGTELPTLPACGMVGRRVRRERIENGKF